MTKALVVIRNVAIVAALALLIAVVPGGGNAAGALVAALIMGFLAAVAMLAARFYRESGLTLSTLADGRRALLYAAVGVIAVMIAGADELLATGVGTLAWIALIALSIVAIVAVWREATTY